MHGFRLVRVLLLSTALLSGCGYLRAESARQSAIGQQLDGYVIKKPIADVWPHAREPRGSNDQLMWDGVTWREIGPFAMRSSRKRDKSTSSGGTTTDSTWYECVATPVPGGTSVRYTRFQEHVGSSGTPLQTQDRAYDLELGLLEIVDPPEGARIKAAGETAAQRAR